ncbi:MAG: nodulation protein NfeD [Zetaproteobacteria bacterium]|nr:MAG: nodulation protein NfeD [Zetaproteobacteria bacterium]
MLRAFRRILGLVLIMIGSTNAIASAPHVLLLDIHGPIGPATAMDVEKAVTQAEQRQTALLILRLDTPGGLDQAMRRIIRSIMNSGVPVAAYVAPSGARAASAGTYILYAAHIAAMAPATNLGAATPIAVGGLPGTSKGEKNGKSTDDGDMHRKMVNDAVAYIRSLAELRHRNADWAEKAVRQAASLSASQALRSGVIDLIAENTDVLLNRLDGRSITLADGTTRVLHTRNAVVETIERDWRSRLLGMITHPNIAYILLLLGLYGLFFELANPGFVLPGVIGAISLLLALYAMQLLPIDFTGLALILLGIGFMIAEAFAPSFGILGLGGILAFVIGSLMLMDTQAPGFAISLQLILGLALATAAFFILIVGMALKARRRPVVSGASALVGQLARAETDFSEDGTGTIKLMGELWNARCSLPVKRGDKVRILAVHGLTLSVEPVDGNDPVTTKQQELCT